MTGAVAALGASKTLFEVVSGNSVGVQEVAYYVGEAGFIVWIGFLGGLLVSFVAGFLLLPVLFLIVRLLGEKHRRSVDLALAGIGLALGLACWMWTVWYLATLPSVFNYEEESRFYRGLIAVAGVAFLGGGVYFWRHLRHRSQE